jgi:hypothetical protein
LPWAGAPPPLITVAGGDARIGPLVLRVTRAVGAVAGRVVDADGAPVADAFVRLGPVWGTVGGAPVARTTPDGRFELATEGAGAVRRRRRAERRPGGGGARRPRRPA